MKGLNLHKYSMNGSEFQDEISEFLNFNNFIELKCSNKDEHFSFNDTICRSLRKLEISQIKLNLEKFT